MRMNFKKILCVLGLALPSIAQAQVTLYSNDFNAAAPWGMTIQDLTGSFPDHVWFEGLQSRANQTGGTGDYASADSDYWCWDIFNTSLTTPSLDFGTYVNVELTFRSRFRNSGGGALEHGVVEVSSNGGATWTEEYYVEITQPNGGVIVTVDLSDYDMTSNVLVRWRYVDDYICAWYWQIDDVSITGDNAPPCSAPPTAGSAAGSAPAVCTGSNVGLGLVGNTIGLGQTYQWQTSTDGFIWTDILGAITENVSIPVNDTTYFRSIVTCSGQSDTSTAVMVTTDFMLCYCQASHNYDCSIDYTSNVTFGSINNNSTCGGAVPFNYSDYTNLSTTVIPGNSYPISVTTDGDSEGVGVWIDFDQSGTFDASEFVLNGFTGDVPETYTGNVLIPANAIPGNTRMRVRNRYNNNISSGDACATFTYGEVEEYTIEVLPPPADEAGVLEITRPGIAACALGNQVWVNLQNLGTNDLVSATFDVKINGLPIPATPWSGLIASGAVQEVQVPLTYALSDGDSISVTVQNPNGQTENPLFAFNNHVGRRVYAGLSGNKTVYGVGADYNDLDEAIEDLELRGVCDTVFFKIASGIYNTQHVFGPYPAANTNKLAVFESATGNASDVEFSYATSSGTNYVFQFNGASNYTIRNLSVTSTGTSYAGVINFTNNAHHIELAENILFSDSTVAYSPSDFDKILVTSDFNNGTDYDNIWIHDNQIIGGVRSFDLEINDGEYQSGFVIENNELLSYSVLGILTYNTSNIVIKNNIFRPRVDIMDEVYGIYILQGYDGGDISGNDIRTYGPGMGILLYDVLGGTSPLLVSNNFIYAGDATNNNISFGIYAGPYNYMINNIMFANNSISIASDNSSAAGLYVDIATSISVVNNNIASTGAAPALRIVSNNAIAQIGNNNLYGSTIADIDGSSFSNITALQSAGYGTNSISVDPAFNGMDLHTCATELNAAGSPLPSVTNDFDGDVRGVMPDIGADEFLGDANGLLIEDAFLKCPADQVAIGNTALNGVTYSWSPSGNTSEITTTNAGTFIITATSACGSFSDTATVVNKPLPTASFTSATVGLAGIFDNNSTNGTSYMWDFGDGNTSTEVSPSHVYSSAGTYSVTLTVTNDCGTATFGPTPVNVINAGIDENIDMHVSLFPNPTNGQFTIALSATSNEQTTISVIDMTGKTIMLKNVAAGINQITLGATTFSSGIYSVKISNGAFAKVIRLVRK